MALVHGLTFFIGQGLVDMGLHDVSLKTPSFQSLLKLVELERHNSPDLFRTIQQGNPYANETRQLFMDKLASIQHPVESTD